MTETALKRRPFLFGAGAAGLMAALSQQGVAQQGPAQGLALPVTGITATGQQIIGTFTPTAAALSASGAPVLQGILRLATAAGPQQLQLPIQIQQATCTILELELGPLDLNLLGLEIHLNRVHLVIEGNPQGGLLGQLLCGIAGLLGGGPLNLTQLLSLLNQLLALFR